MEHVTLKDVAKATGFSITTVSRVLGGVDYPVHADTRDTICKAAKELNYIPNILARSLKTQVSKDVAVVMPSITNPFYTSIIMGIEGALSAQGYNMLTYLTRMNRAKDSELVTSLRGKMIAGVIVAADCLTPSLSNSLLLLKKSGIPFVITDYTPDLSEPSPGVFFDYRRGGQMAARYLLEQGHRRIAYATRTLDRLSRRGLKDGFCEVMASLGAPFGEKDVFISRSKSDFDASAELAQLLLEKAGQYTAVFANNDAVAVGMIAELARQGVRVPEDISVMGFDNCVFAKMSSPALTTVQVPAEDMGSLAAKSILEELAGKKVEYSIYLEPKIVERRSVQKL